jgi:hypothetical protein
MVVKLFIATIGIMFLQILFQNIWSSKLMALEANKIRATTTPII